MQLQMWGKSVVVGIINESMSVKESRYFVFFIYNGCLDDSYCNLSPWCCYNWSFLSYFHLIVAVLILSVSFKFLILSCYQTRESLPGITSHAYHFPRTSLVVGYLATPPGMALVSCKKSGGDRPRVPSHHFLAFYPLLRVLIDPSPLPPPPLLLRSFSRYFGHLRRRRVHTALEWRTFIVYIIFLPAIHLVIHWTAACCSLSQGSFRGHWWTPWRCFFIPSFILSFIPSSVH